MDRKSHPSRLRMSVAAATAMAVLAAVAGATPDARAQEEDLWQRGRNFHIRLEAQDTTDEGQARANTHPAKITATRIASALSQVQFSLTADGNSYPLFGEDNLELLSAYAAEGLAKATPRQDVTFVLKNWVASGLLSIREPFVVGGRMFVRKGRLNLILGSVRPSNRRTGSETELKALNKDIRLYPYFSGARGKKVKNDVYIRAEADSGVYSLSTDRSDWLVFTDKAMSAPPVTDRDQQEAIRLLQQKLKAQQKEVQRLSRQPARSGAPQPADAATAERSGTADTATTANIEQRLRALQQLRDKGLIGKDDYEDKRRKILEEL